MKSVRNKIELEIEKVGDWDDCEIVINANENVKKDFGYLMVAAEYLLYVAASNSNAGFEKALDRLKEGAIHWKTKNELSH